MAKKTDSNKPTKKTATGKRTSKAKPLPLKKVTEADRMSNRRMAAAKAGERPAAPPRFMPPALMPGVVPEGATPAIAMDYAPGVYDFASSCMPWDFVGFPGYPYLANLATRAEYRAFADTMSTELTREWIKLKSKQDGTGDKTQDNARIAELEEAIKAHDLKGIFSLAAAQDCFFGRAQISINIKGAEPRLPLVLAPQTVRQGSLEGFTCVEAMWTTPSMYNALDPTAPDFYKPRAWFVLGQEVHASRLLTIVTRPLPDMLKPAYNFSGMSLSQLAEPYVNNWLRTRQSVSDLINNFSITALKTNMSQVLQGDCDGSDVFARADMFTATRSNRGLMLLDKDAEELVQVNVPLSGLHELQAQAQEHMCSVSKIPAMILTGISPSGLNASSEGEIRAFYDWVSAQQEAHWRHPLETCIHLIMLDLWGEIDPTITFEFCPLWQVSAMEQANIRKADADTTAVLIDRGVISQEEARENLASNPDSGYSGIDVSDLPPLPEEPGQMDLFGLGEPGGEQEDGSLGADKSVSEKQHRAMEAAAHGKSTLGIPQEVGQEFVDADRQS